MRRQAELMMKYYELDPLEQIWDELEWKYEHFFFQDNANVISKMGTILSRRCVKAIWYNGWSVCVCVRACVRACVF